MNDKCFSDQFERDQKRKQLLEEAMPKTDSSNIEGLAYGSWENILRDKESDERARDSDGDLKGKIIY